MNRQKQEERQVIARAEAKETARTRAGARYKHQQDHR